jgi:small subunit ribosomal protein S8
MVTDPVADLIIRLKNAGKVHKESVLLPYSKLKEAIATVLVAEGYLKSVSKKKTSPVLEVVLNYHNGESKIKDVERISKSSRRVYRGFEDIHPIKGGFGKTIFSTPKGILTDRQAIKEKVGGEVLFKIW